MRIPCEVVFSRHKTNGNLRQVPDTSKPRKGFVVLEKLRQTPPQYQILFAVNGDKNTNKFDLNKPPIILDKFVQQGKVTFQFPAVTVYIGKACPESLTKLTDCIRKIVRGEAVEIEKVKIKSSDFKPTTITVTTQNDYRKQMNMCSEFLRTLKIEPIDLRTADRTWISKCKNITQLIISGNPIGNRATNLDVFSKLPHLHVLELNNCSLGSVAVPVLCDMFKRLPITLNFLDISENQLSVFPPIFHLNQLRVINATFNNIKYLPSRIGSLQNLQTISLNHNQMSSLPYVFPKMPRIQHVGLQANDDLCYTSPEDAGPLITRKLASKVDNNDYSHAGGVDSLVVIAANAIHRDENRKSLRACRDFLPLSLRFHVEDLMYETPGISPLEMCTYCLRLRHIRYVRPQLLQSRQIAEAVDVVDRFVIFDNLLCIDCHRRTPATVDDQTPIQYDFFNFSL
ncbi:hypothetical protein GCK72_005934 [Caenorhabditis remanei]|uniref:CRE-LRR-1 protein n=1 Tax=Caenorhabditis remanei TaxID=31234 RepID=E3M4C5_CAERE|nr:hypothetical protein GCK72_005934 [Caenorhabditis remanei]EFO91601.1 CRE-LRR-1 protein [Caenorhabditis remanei]KAF1765980.1 hypothetical protein GCK72_005934 [Caenorhabditis remanei]